MNNRKVLIGVDFGGTKILTGAINERGEILCEPVKVPTSSQDPGERIIGRVLNSIEKVIQVVNPGKDAIAGIGMGVTGPLDIKNGVILECPQLPTLHFFPLRETVEQHFHLPVYMNNDANCLIYGEALFGSGVGKNIVLGFTLGTGLGCAIIINRKIYIGATESAGEIWPSPYENGTIEDLVSGAGVTKIYKKISGDDKSALEIETLARSGDEAALATWDEFGKHLSVAISWSMNLVDPDIVILGGSISNAFDLFFNSLEKNLRKHICPVPAQRTKMVAARLGSNAGFIGAAALALENNK
ncbi:MAG: ROK family protein [Candidatus Kryptoniota bacterium]